MADREVVEAFKTTLSMSRRMMLDLADEDEGDEDIDQAEQDNVSEESEDEALGAIFSRHIL